MEEIFETSTILKIAGNINKIKHTCDKPVTVGTGLTGMGTGLVLGTEKCILIRTHDTHTRVPAGYIRTRAHH
jgi:hypothetical protein